MAPSTAATSVRPVTGPAFVEIDHVSKTHFSKRGNVEALHDINVGIAQSEFLSVLGPSGCGKSTLLRCLAGLDRPSSGELRIGGYRIDGPPENLGIVFQRDVLFDWRTVIENILLPVEIQGLPIRDWAPKAQALLDLLGLAGFENRHPWELSGGMRQRVSICRALILAPSLLLMDEPFGALDALTRDELNLELQRVWLADAKTVFFVTHSIAEAIFLADRVMVMSPSPGQLVEVVTVELPRPRDLSVRETPEFSRYMRHIRTLFQDMGFMRGTVSQTRGNGLGP
jgi:NitT/TauT family transport system ATP-binding protein